MRRLEVMALHIPRCRRGRCSNGLGGLAIAANIRFLRIVIVGSASLVQEPHRYTQLIFLSIATTGKRCPSQDPSSTFASKNLMLLSGL